MKKIIILTILIFTIIILSNVITGAIVTKLEPSNNNTDEKLYVQKVLKETYATEMIFKGESNDWQAKYVVDKKVLSDEENTGIAKLYLIPKINYAEKMDQIWYHVKTTQGYTSATTELLENNNIELTENSPIPLSDESIVITIVYGNKTEKIVLNNTFPENIISADTAFKSTLDKYIEIYNQYPELSHTFYIELYDNNNWIISYDDNDNIGGKAYIEVDGITGESSDMKIEE
ncbi:MAG: hypothetical protein ABF289_03775 [Clostridiales bacterium]